MCTGEAPETGGTCAEFDLAPRQHRRIDAFFSATKAGHTHRLAVF
jgi:hypothetical protein